MRDEEVASLLDSNNPLVVVEAPAGCGKTFQGSAYAARVSAAANTDRLLVLTHTHAAKEAFGAATGGGARRVDIRTIDSFITSIASSYSPSLGFPSDVGRWAQSREGGFAEVASRVATLLTNNPYISDAIAERYPIVICDEHQDSSTHQNSIVMSLLKSGARVRIFGDPMQMIYSSGATHAQDLARWVDLTKKGAFAQLVTGHRWKKSAPDLAEWILTARLDLMNGRQVNIRGNLPKGLTVIQVENVSPARNGIAIDYEQRKLIDWVFNQHRELMILCPFNDHAVSLRSFWNRRVSIWEGHTRKYLSILVSKLQESEGNAEQVARNLTWFVGETCKGFTPSKYGNRFLSEVSRGCTGKTRGLPMTLQKLGKYVVDSPDHRGLAKSLNSLYELIQNDEPGFDVVDCDRRAEFRDAIRLGRYDDLKTGVSEIQRQRSFSKMLPPPKAISNIHKAKGLESENVLVIPCDNQGFRDTPVNRCKLYVALSRPKTSLTIVLCTNDFPQLFTQRG